MTTKAAWSLCLSLLVGGVLATQARKGMTDEPVNDDESIEWPAGVEREAALPEGFPPPSPVGEVVEKTYPLARTYSAEGGQRSAFWRCFRHLREHNHEMTAPVISEYQHQDSAESSQQTLGEDSAPLERMHFVLEEPTMDEPGEYGPIIVEDMPEMQVLSIAFQGRLTDEQKRECETRLEEELEARADLESAGHARILGYNSPMIPAEKRYWEIQIPVRAAE